MRGRTFKDIVRNKYMPWIVFPAFSMLAVHLAARLIWNYSSDYRQLAAQQCMLDGYMPAWMVGDGYINDPSLTARCGWTDTFNWWDYHPQDRLTLLTTHILGFVVVASIAGGLVVIGALVWAVAWAAKLTAGMVRWRSWNVVLQWQLLRMHVIVSRKHPLNIEGTFDYNPRAHYSFTDEADTDWPE